MLGRDGSLSGMENGLQTVTGNDGQAGGTSWTELLPRQTDERTWLWDVPDGWQQGRGAWGGLVVAAMLSPATAGSSTPSLPVRSLTAQILAPVPLGEVLITTRELRRGSATSTMAVELAASLNAPVLAHAVVVQGAPRAPHVGADGPDWQILTPPELPAWQGVPVVPVMPPMGPVFSQHLEYRPVLGVPGSGHPSGECLGWVRPDPQGALVAGDRFDERLLMAMIDAWWPASLAKSAQVRPLATIAFTAELTVDPSTLPVAEPLFHRGRLIAARQGYAVETRELWSAEGVLVAHNTQTVAIIK